jgi:hypothetical protein
MDDDMKARTRARRARERLDRSIDDEKRRMRPADAAPRDYVVAYDSVNVRDAPRVSATRVGALPRGTLVRVARLQGNWAQLANGNWMMIDGSTLGLPILLAPAAAGAPSPPPPPPSEADVRLSRDANGRPRFDAIDGRRRLVTVLGTKGAAVRKGASVESDLVRVLVHLETCAYTGRQTRTDDGRIRVEIDAPVAGWVSLRFLGPLETDGGS